MASRAAILLACGTVAFATGAIVVHAATSAQISKKKTRQAWPAFMINAQVAQQLSPGRTVPIKLSLANNRIKPIWITRLAVQLSVDAPHAARGCSAERDYRVVQMPRTVFPFKLVGHSKATKKRKARLRWRVLRPSRTKNKPALMMVNLPGVNQNACKGATVTVGFVSKSTNRKPKRKKAWKAASE